jgi:hypothetical protein
MESSLVSTTALAGIPEFIEAAAGKAAVSRVFQVADIPLSVIGRRDYLAASVATRGAHRSPGQDR